MVRLSRRDFLKGVGQYAAGATFLRLFPVAQATPRIRIPHGVQSGEVNATGAVVWSASDRPARMVVE
ncbi:MAG: twin-arginine translocation signal domain-containing protein [Armatimonadota bacterium]|nr:twin-arginine translocation signal domain-containing protein [Armatimonadota bacterium]